MNYTDERIRQLDTDRVKAQLRYLYGDDIAIIILFISQTF